MGLVPVPATCYIGSSTPTGDTLAGYDTLLDAVQSGTKLAAFRTYYHIDSSAISARDTTAGASGAYGWFSFRADTTAGFIHTWNSIAAGSFDSLIIGIADALHAYGYPCWATFNHEPLHSAKTVIPGVCTVRDDSTPAHAAIIASEWRAAYEHFVNVVKARYAAQGWTLNVSFAPILQHYQWQGSVWAPMTQWVPSVGVDWYAIDTYGTATTAAFFPAYQAFYNWCGTNLPGVPLANCEVTHQPGIATWLYTSPAVSGSLNYDIPHKMPNMKMWFYWNQQSSASNWNVQTGGTAAMANLINSVAGSPVLTPPVNTVAPGVAGSVIEGSLLTEDDGTWTGTATPTLTRKWQVSADNVAWSDVSPAATATTYMIPGGGTVLGDYYRVNVTGTNASGTATAHSNSVGPVVTSSKPVNTVLPVISGTVQDTETLSVTDGTWTSADSLAYQWEKSTTGNPGTFTNVTAATANTYVIPSSGSEGLYLRCKVTGTNINGDTDAWATKVGPIAPLVAPNIAPVLVVFGPADVVVLPASALALATATDDDGIAGVTVALDGGSPAAMTNTSGDDYALDLGVLSNGLHSVSVAATDSNAAPLTTTVVHTFTVQTQNPGGGGTVTISTDIAEVEVRIHQRGLA